MLVDLKMEKPELEQKSPVTGPYAEVPEQDEYSVRIYLGKEELAKLGVSPANFKLGDTGTINAEVKVCRLSESADEWGKSESLEFEVQKLDLGTFKKKEGKSIDAALREIQLRVK